VLGRRDYPIQFIDVGDLAQWMMEMVERKISGVFNSTGPGKTLTMEQFVCELEDDIPSSGKTTWVSEDFLQSKGVKEWAELPLWISDKTAWPGFTTVNVGRLIAYGLTYRPLRETILDTLRWDQIRSEEGHLKAGLSREREADFLRTWKAWDAG